MDVLILNLSSVGIKGECTFKGYKDMIEVLSYQHAVPQKADKQSTKTEPQSFMITKYVDLSSCELVDFCNCGKNIPTAVLTIGAKYGDDVVKVMEYTLSDAWISSVSVGGGGGGKPQETVTFKYAKISWEPSQPESDATK